FSVSVSADLRLNQPILRVAICCARTESGIASAGQTCKKFPPPHVCSPPAQEPIVLVEVSALIGGEAVSRCSLWVKSRTCAAQTPNVRFTSKSRHVQRRRLCPLWAKSGHPCLFDHFVSTGD